MSVFFSPSNPCVSPREVDLVSPPATEVTTPASATDGTKTTPYIPLDPQRVEVLPLPGFADEGSATEKQDDPPPMPAFFSISTLNQLNRYSHDEQPATGQPLNQQGVLAPRQAVPMGAPRRGIPPANNPLDRRRTGHITGIVRGPEGLYEIDREVEPKIKSCWERFCNLLS